MNESALRQAFNLLVDAADPETAATALRHALATLLRSGSFKGIGTADRVRAAAKAPRRPHRRAAPGAPGARRRGRPPKAKPNGSAPSGETGLTPDERTKLGFLHSAGRARGIGPSLLQNAIDGAELAPADVDRVRALLAG
jgi:hypothetical protein